MRWCFYWLITFPFASACVCACVRVCVCGSLSVCVTASACSCTCILVCLHDSWTTYNAIHRTYMSVPLSFSFPFYGLKTRIVHIAAGGELATSRCCWILIVCVLSSNAAFCHFPLPLTCPCTFCARARVCVSPSVCVCLPPSLPPSLHLPLCLSVSLSLSLCAFPPFSALISVP